MQDETQNSQNEVSTKKLDPIYEPPRSFPKANEDLNFIFKYEPVEETFPNGSTKVVLGLPTIIKPGDKEYTTALAKINQGQRTPV